MALAVVATLTACSAPPSDADHHDAPTPSSAAAAAPSGSVTVGCDQARADSPRAPAPGPDDLIIGPLAYQGAIESYQGTDLPGTAPVPNADGVTYFKTGADLPPDATVTVSIDENAQSYAGIVTENGPVAGYSTVTYVSCRSKQQSTRTWWAGGFALTGRKTACVPITVQVKGERDVHQAQVSLATEPCKR